MLCILPLLLSLLDFAVAAPDARDLVPAAVCSQQLEERVPMRTFDLHFKDLEVFGRKSPIFQVVSAGAMANDRLLLLSPSQIASADPAGGWPALQLREAHPPHREVPRPDIESVLQEAITARGLGQLLFVTSVTPSTSTPVVAVAGFTSTSDYVILVADIASQASRVLIHFRGDRTFRPQLTISKNGRFVVVRESSARLEKNIRIFDLHESRSLWLVGPPGDTIRISESGDRLLVSARTFDEKSRRHILNQHLATNLNHWRSGDTEVAIGWEALAPVNWEGLVLDADDDLRRFVVDTNNGNASFAYVRLMSGYPHLEPKLKKLEVRDSLRWLPLRGWGRIEELMRQAAQVHLIAKYGDMSGQFSPDNRFFLLHLKMTSERHQVLRPSGITYRHSFVQDMVAIWDITANRLVAVRNSRELDSPGDVEPTALVEPNLVREMVWPRQFAVQWTRENEVILLRALVHDIERPRQRVVAKLGRLTVLDELSLQAFQLEEVNPDTQGSRAQWIGVSRLSLTPQGQFGFVEVTGVGLLGLRPAKAPSTLPQTHATSEP